MDPRVGGGAECFTKQPDLPGADQLRVRIESTAREDQRTVAPCSSKRFLEVGGRSAAILTVERNAIVCKYRVRKGDGTSGAVGAENSINVDHAISLRFEKRYCEIFRSRRSPVHVD